MKLWDKLLAPPEFAEGDLRRWFGQLFEGMKKVAGAEDFPFNQETWEICFEQWKKQMFGEDFRAKWKRAMKLWWGWLFVNMVAGVNISNLVWPRDWGWWVPVNTLGAMLMVFASGFFAEAACGARSWMKRIRYRKKHPEKVHPLVVTMEQLGTIPEGGEEE